MPLTPLLRLTAALALLCASSCSYDLAERPNAGLVAEAVDNKPPAAKASLLDVRWEMRELAGQPAPATEETPYFVLHDGRTRTEGRAGFRVRTASRPWASCASAR